MSAPHRQSLLSVARSRVATVVVTGVGVLVQGCKSETGEHHAPAATTPAVGRGVRWIHAPKNGAVAPLVRTELARASAEGRQLLVYVGAVWCEPCQRFHHAAEQGELDTTFPTLTVLEFDLDRDAARLDAAGYGSRYIPLFAVAGEDGAASKKRVEGGIKGDGAVSYISAKLKDLLSGT